MLQAHDGFFKHRWGDGNVRSVTAGFTLQVRARPVRHALIFSLLLLKATLVQESQLCRIQSVPYWHQHFAVM